MTTLLDRPPRPVFPPPARPAKVARRRVWSSTPGETWPSVKEAQRAVGLRSPWSVFCALDNPARLAAGRRWYSRTRPEWARGLADPDAPAPLVVTRLGHTRQTETDRGSVAGWPAGAKTCDVRWAEREREKANA